MTHQTYPILKDLNAVLTYATERFKNEFVWQEIKLKEAFKLAIENYLAKKNSSVEYMSVTSIVTTRKDQQIFIANQWFAIASYYVDFCTELLTYQEYFEKICLFKGINDRLKYASRLKTCATADDKQSFFDAAYTIINR